MTRNPDRDLGAVLEALADELLSAGAERQRLEARRDAAGIPPGAPDRLGIGVALLEAAAAERALLRLYSRLKLDASEAHAVTTRMLFEQCVA